MAECAQRGENSRLRQTQSEKLQAQMPPRRSHARERHDAKKIKDLRGGKSQATPKSSHSAPLEKAHGGRKCLISKMPASGTGSNF